MYDKPGLRGQARGGPLRQSGGVLRKIVAWVARRDTGKWLACSRRNGGVWRCIEARRLRSSGRSWMWNVGRLRGRGRGLPPRLSHGGGAAARLCSSCRRHVLRSGGRNGGLGKVLALQDHLLQLLDLHPPQVSQLPVTLVDVDEVVQGHLPIQEGVGHVLMKRRSLGRKQRNTKSMSCL